jgi:urea carboxylase
MELFFSQAHKVDRNSNRLGYRLTPLKWQWARRDGGIAGKHPSNILDNAYAVGAVNLSGDQPIIITCDGPSLGGFICSAVVVSGALWKVGQVVPGRDTIRFQRVSLDEALALRAEVDKAISAA